MHVVAQELAEPSTREIRGADSGEIVRLLRIAPSVLYDLATANGAIPSNLACRYLYFTEVCALGHRIAPTVSM